MPDDTAQDILEVFALSAESPALIPAPIERDWMEYGGRHAYRCLPLTIGNTFGWQLLLPVDITASWNGGPNMADISIVCARPRQAMSNFSNGILTFDLGYIFRTPPDVQILITGPSNTFKDGIAAMTAVVESDWLPYGFTMNYRFTRPGRVTWAAGEPYAQLCLVRVGAQQAIQPVIRRLDADPQLRSDLVGWQARRAEMRTRVASRDPAALQAPWDKDYFIGRYADGRPTSARHVQRLRLRTPIDERD